MSLFFLELKDSGKKLIPPKEWQCNMLEELKFV